MFSGSDDPDFDSIVQQQMVRDGVRGYLHFIAMSDAPASEDYNVFAVLDCNSDAQALRLARKYFHSVIAFGRVQGPLRLKNM